MVWAGNWSGGRVGPFFIDGTLNSHKYLELLQNTIWPTIETQVRQARLWFKQDGAPPHFQHIIRNWLNRNFADRWIGRGGPIEWPPRSCDITPADFFLWGYLKERVYHRRPRNIGELKQFITEEFNTIPQSMIRNATRSVVKRLEILYENSGKNIVTDRGMHCEARRGSN
jgi:hypothetical protein